MAIRDCQIDWIRERKEYNAFDLHAILSDGTAGFFSSNGNLPADEIGSSGLVGIQCTTAGSVILGYFKCPIDVDPRFPVGFKVLYSGEITTAGATIDWICLQDCIKEGEAIAAPTAALDTVIAEDTYLTNANATTTTDNLLQITARGIRNTLGLTRDDIERGAYVALSIENNAHTTLDSVQFIGVEFDYVPMRTEGFGNEGRGAPLHTHGIS